MQRSKSSGRRWRAKPDGKAMKRFKRSVAKFLRVSAAYLTGGESMG